MSERLCRFLGLQSLLEVRCANRYLRAVANSALPLVPLNGAKLPENVGRRFSNLLDYLRYAPIFIGKAGALLPPGVEARLRVRTSVLVSMVLLVLNLNRVFVFPGT